MPNYASHIGSLVKSVIKNDGLILELGSGDGYQTSFVMMPSRNFYCVESDSIGLQKLISRGYQVSQTLDNFTDGTVSSIFSINCLEHIKDDSGVINKIGSCLDSDGTLILYLPAFNFLFSSMDTRVGHFRRYSRKSITKICESNGFRIEKSTYVDSVGAFITLIFKLSGNKNGVPSKKSLIFFNNYLFPISCFLDKFLGRIFGKNIFVVARKIR